jgi:hypothetical protein
MTSRIPHKHRRIAYGASLASYFNEYTCPTCYPRWRNFLAALLRTLADRLDGARGAT